MFSKCCAIVPKALHKKMLKKKTGTGQNMVKHRLDKGKTTPGRNGVFYAQQPRYEKKPSFASLIWQ
jgi:hypothetical protein